MAGPKIDAVNVGIQECIEPMRVIAIDNNVDLQVRVITFSDSAKWLVEQKTNISEFQWTFLTKPDGVTDMGKAFELAADALDTKNMPDRGLPPVLVLMSDGHATDDVKGGLKKLLDQPWGIRSVRVAVAIGKIVNHEDLVAFTGDSERVLSAANPTQLMNHIKWLTTVAVMAVAKQETDKGATGGVRIPRPLRPPSDIVEPGDVF